MQRLHETLGAETIKRTEDENIHKYAFVSNLSCAQLFHLGVQREDVLQTACTP